MFKINKFLLNNNVNNKKFSLKYFSLLSSTNKSINSVNLRTRKPLKNDITSKTINNCCLDDISLAVTVLGSVNPWSAGWMSVTKRYYSSIEKGPKERKLPELMEFQEIIWPSVFKTIKNWILIHFLIKPYFDQDFTSADFTRGSKQAVQVISSKLTNGDMNNLTGLVSNDAIQVLQQTISNMSVAQRNELQVRKEDIYLAFPYQIGIMFDEPSDAIQKRFVEITMVYHVLRGLHELRKEGVQIPLNVGVMPEYRDKISICNYRFIKEFTQGSTSDWTVNIVNHFKPSDFIDE